MATRIDGFDVEPVTQATAGSELLFTLYGSPGGQARVQITGATGQALLEELEPGLYEGVYTVRSRDRITAASSVTVNLRNGNQVATAMLDESLIGQPRSRRPIPSSNSVRVDRFGLEQPPSLAAGNELRFNATGTPDAVASVRIAGVRGRWAHVQAQRAIHRRAPQVRDHRVEVLHAHQWALRAVASVLADDDLAAAREEGRQVRARGVHQRRGLLHARGEGVPNDDEASFHYFERAAGAGYPDAMFQLGQAYRKGQGIEVDAIEARKWYGRAADAGQPEAMNEYGVALAEGFGGPEDLVEGCAWIYAAVGRGASDAAIRNVETLAQNMRPFEIKAARKRGRAILKLIERGG